MSTVLEMAWDCSNIGKETSFTSAPMLSNRLMASKTAFLTWGSSGASKYSLGMPMRRPLTSPVSAVV